MGKAKIVTELKNNYFTNNKITYASAQPTSGTYNAGDIVISKTPNSTAYGWICVSSGSPGTWKIMKSASDLQSVSWGNVSGKPSTFPAIIGTTSTTATRGDIGQTAYNHSQAAHAPVNAQRNADITKAEIEAKLTGNITTHTHNYAPTNHGTHVPNKEPADNRKFLCSDGKWKALFPNYLNGVANYPLPEHISGSVSVYMKVCSVQKVPTDNSHCEILFSGNGDFGQVGHSIGILRVSGRGEGAVKYLHLMKSDTEQIEVGFVKNSSSIDVWVKRPMFDGIGAMTVLGVSPRYCTIFKDPELTTNKPSGYQAIVNDELFKSNRNLVCLDNDRVYKGITTDYTAAHHLIGVDGNNNIFLGWNNQTYIHLYDTMRVYRDVHVQGGASVYARGARINRNGGGTINLGSNHVRFEYVKGECVQVAGGENDLYGYHIPFRAKHVESVANWVKFGPYWFTIGPNASPANVGDVWFKV